MAKPEKRSIRLIRSPWLSLHRRLRQRRPGSLRLIHRRRQWAFLLLGIMLALVGVFFHLTNSSNLRTSAEDYLRGLVNGEVKVGKASFGLLQGIKLADISIKTMDDQPGNLVFRADSINLKVSWWALLRGKLAAREILAYRPEVLLVESNTGHWNYEPLFMERKFTVVRPLPRIMLRDGRIHYYEEISGKLVHGGTFNLTASFEPAGSDKQGYNGEVETTLAGQRIARLSGYFDTASGTFSQMVAQISLTQSVRQSLPRRVRAWMEKYNISGQLSVSGHYDPQTEVRIIANLEGVDFRLPLNEQVSIAIDDVHGQMQFSDKDIRLGSYDPDKPTESQPLKLTALGGKWEISGRLNGYDSQADFELQVSCSDLSLPEDQELINALPKVHRMVLEDWKPSGRIEVRSLLRRTAEVSPEIQADGFVRCIDVTAGFRQFPYKLQDIKGIVRFDAQKTMLEDFQARHLNQGGGFAELQAKGRISPPYENCEADIVITANNIVLDSDLRLALQEKDRVQYDKFDPSGKAEVTCRLVHTSQQNEEWLTYIDGNLTDASLTAQEFPYPLKHLRGRLYIGPDTVEIGQPPKDTSGISEEKWADSECVGGLAGSAPVRFRGLLGNLGQEDEWMKLWVQADTLELDEVLAKALPPRARELFDTLSPSGKANISGKIATLKSKPDEPDFLINVWPMNAACRHREFPYPLEQVTGHVVLSPGRFEVQQFHARQGIGSFSGSGFVASEDNQHYKADLSIDGQNVQFDKTAYDCLDPEQQEIWDDLQPQGTCDVNLKIINDPAGELTYRAKLLPHQAQATYKLVPYPLNNLTGQLDLQPEMAVVDIQSQAPKVGVHGQIQYQAAKPLAELVVMAEDIELDDKFKAVLPEDAQKIWDAVGLGGAIDIKVDKIDYSPADSGPKKLNLEGSVALKRVSLKRPVACTGLFGDVNGALLSGAEGMKVRFLGQIAMPRLMFGPIPLENIKAAVAKSSSQDRGWSVEDIQAELAGGRVVGSIKAGQDAEGRFLAVVQAENVDLQMLLQQVHTKNSPPASDQNEQLDVKGRIKASLKLEGKLSEPGDISGRGLIVVDEAQLYRLPLIIRIMSSLRLQPVNTNAFDKASVDFYLEGQDIIFSEIVLEGPALRMVGTGKYDQAHDSLQAVIAREQGDNFWSSLPHLPEAVVAEINGPLADPQVQAKPFRDVSEELKQLFHKRQPPQ